MTNEPTIPEHVREKILQRLSEIEKGYGIRILYACESGSRGWGFESPDSDYDIRFIYVHEPEWYVRVTPRRFVINQEDIPIVNDLDFEGWDLSKVMLEVGKGNAVLLEWMYAPIVYMSVPGFIEDARLAAVTTFRKERSFYHYLHMARGGYKEYDRLDSRLDEIPVKKYLYVLRPLLAALWVAAGFGPAPMEMSALLDKMAMHDEDVAGYKADIERLVRSKKSIGELSVTRRIKSLDLFIEKELEKMGEMKVFTVTKEGMEILDGVLSEWILNKP